MESTAQENSQDLQETLTKMYQGYLAGEHSDMADRIERVEMFDGYQAIFALIGKSGEIKE